MRFTKRKELQYKNLTDSIISNTFSTKAAASICGYMHVLAQYTTVLLMIQYSRSARAWCGPKDDQAEVKIQNNII